MILSMCSVSGVCGVLKDHVLCECLVQANVPDCFINTYHITFHLHGGNNLPGYCSL